MDKQSEKNRTPGQKEEHKPEAHETGRDTQKKQQERLPKGDAIARKQQGQRFVSDEDIVRNRTA
jgi:hypothetical protein